MARDSWEKVFKIKHHWLQFKFVPSWGQIHAHILAIADVENIHKSLRKTKGDQRKQAMHLKHKLEKPFGVRANVVKPTETYDKSNETHPAKICFIDTNPAHRITDDCNLQMFCQCHQCSAYCMREQQTKEKKETKEEKRRQVCRNGFGMKKNTNEMWHTRIQSVN